MVNTQRILVKTERRESNKEEDEQLVTEELALAQSNPGHLVELNKLFEGFWVY